MPKTVWAVVREGKIELLESTRLEEGSRVLVTLIEDSEQAFWLEVGQASLNKIWDNPEDDVYAQLLQR